MAKLSLKIGLSIIIAGLFVMLSLIAINYSHAGYLFYLILFLLAVFVFLFGFAAGEKLSLPLKKILTKANQLLGGDLSSRFYSDSKDELGQLGNAFNKIADQLQEQSAENERIKKSLGIKVEVETQALQETISALEQKVQNRSMELQKVTSDLDQFKEFAKSKEAEIGVLKAQIAELKEKSEKKRKPKKEPMANEVAVNQNNNEVSTDSVQGDDFGDIVI